MNILHPYEEIENLQILVLYICMLNVVIKIIMRHQFNLITLKLFIKN